MENVTNQSDSTISVCTAMPEAMRIGLGCIGAFICIVVAIELSPALWPLSILTLFFGLIAFGGICIGLSLIMSCAFGPNVAWKFSPGQLAITQELRGQSSTSYFWSADIAALTIEIETHDSGPDTFTLVCTFASGVMLRPLNGQTAAASAIISLLMSASRHMKDPLANRKCLKSPSFATLQLAQSARALLMGENLNELAACA